MKILYTIAGTYRPAGMERILADKANYLAAQGHKVVIVTTDQNGRENAFPLHGSIRRIDLPVGYEANNGGSFLSKLTAYPAKHRRHRRLLKDTLLQERPDITVSMFCGDEDFLPGIKDGSRKVLEVHFSRFKRLQYQRTGLWAISDRYRSKQDAKHIANFDRFVTLTREDLGYWGAPKNGVCIPNFIEALPQRAADPDIKTVIAVGRLCHQKGFDRLIDAWRIVRKDAASHGWKLRIIGDGEERYRLQKQIDDLALTDHVKLTGPCNDMPSAYTKASILALSSRYEGLPMVLLEAQGYGLPAVSFDCKCGPRDVITDGKDGLLVPEGDIAALAAALLRLIRDDGLRRRMGAAARLSASRWDKETIMHQWLSLFSEI